MKRILIMMTAILIAGCAFAGTSKFDALEVGGGYGSTGCTIFNTGFLATNGAGAFDAGLVVGDADTAGNVVWNSGTGHQANIDYAGAEMLADITTVGTTDGLFLVGNGSTFVGETGSTARTSLGLGSIATQESNNVSITGGAISGITDLAIADGGTGASTAAAACSALGVGVEDTVEFHELHVDGGYGVGKNGVSIFPEGLIMASANIYTKGTVTGKEAVYAGLNGSGGHAGIFEIRNGENPGASCTLDYTDATRLDAIAGLAVTDGNMIVGNGTTWVAKSGAALRTSLGLGSTDQPYFNAVNVYNANIQRISNTTNPFLSFFRMRESPSSIVQVNDVLGSISFNGYDGVGGYNGATIVSTVDATPGINDMPGCLIFSTTPDGATDSIQALKLGNNGVATFGINGAGGRAGAITWCNGANPGSTTEWTYTDASHLDTLAGLSKTDGNFVVTNGTTFVAESGATARTSIGLGTGDSPQFTGVTATGGITTYGAFSMFSYSDTAAAGATFQALRARGTGTTVVQSEDVVYIMPFYGYDGSNWKNAARMRVDIDGTPGTNDMPGRFVFLVTPDGSATLAEAFRISNTKYIQAVGVYNQTSASAANVVVDSSGNLMRSTSGEQFKTNIQDLGDTSAVLQLQPRKYTSKIDEDREARNKIQRVQLAEQYLEMAQQNGSAKDMQHAQEELAAARAEAAKPVEQKQYFGLVAQEVAQVLPELVTYDDKGEPDSVAYERVAVLLIGEVKKLKARVDELERNQAQIDDLIKRIEKLEKK